MRGYTQLTREERYQIYVLKRTGHSQREMAGILKRSPATISRELRRNCGGRGYRPNQAARKALERRRLKIQPRITASMWATVEALLRQDWSPEQIAGRLAREKRRRISHEWIYQRIYADKARGGDLHTHLRCRKQRRKRYGHYSRRGLITGQVRIDQRPAIVAQRKRIGDWESDTIIGVRHRGALVSTVERKSNFTVLAPVQHKTAAAVRRSLSEELKPHRRKVLTVTVDNGREWSDHQGIARDLKADLYFAHPYASWERGLGENTNGLIRQYFPKTMDLSKVSKSATAKVMHRLNHRPRKSLDYQTPYEVFFDKATWLTVALTS